MDTAKSIFTSKTFWGVILMVAGRFVPESVGLTSDVLVDIASQVISAIGAILAVYGRWTAKATISGLLSPAASTK